MSSGSLEDLRYVSLILNSGKWISSQIQGSVFLKFHKRRGFDHFIIASPQKKKDKVYYIFKINEKYNFCTVTGISEMLVIQINKI